MSRRYRKLRAPFEDRMNLSFDSVASDVGNEIVNIGTTSNADPDSMLEIKKAQHDESNNSGARSESRGPSSLMFEDEECRYGNEKNIDSERPVADNFDDNPDLEELDNCHQNRSKRGRVWRKLFHCLCPFLEIFRALLRCDMDTVWSLLPSIVVLKAAYSSCLTLGLCTLFKVERLMPNHNASDTTLADDGGTSSFVKEAYFFGLFTYTGKIPTEDSLQSFVQGEMEKVETCRFHMNRVEDDAADELFLNDAAFTVARVLAIAATGLGFIAMIGVFLTAANYRFSCRGSKIYILFLSLCVCGTFQFMVLLVFASSVCRDTQFDERRRCTVQDGSFAILTSGLCWYLTALATLKMPRNREASEIEHHDKIRECEMQNQGEDERTTILVWDGDDSAHS